MFSKKQMTVLIVLIFGVITVLMPPRTVSQLPLVAIANYGPDPSLTASIEGIKKALARQGFIENRTVRYEMTDVGFDASRIPQMITKLKSLNPKVMVVMTTPVAQFAKATIKNCPLVFDVVTDPIEAGLLEDRHSPDRNMTGSSDQQDLARLLDFTKQLIPHAKSIGLLYATAESNDTALVKMMRQAALSADLKVLAIPVNQVRDIPIALQNFRNKVDVIYVGASGPIQPALPVIVAESKKMRIPVLNVDEVAVSQGMVLASYGVDYTQVGIHAGRLVASILKGQDVSTLPPQYPGASDYHAFISRSNAATFDLKIPVGIKNMMVVE